MLAAMYREQHPELRAAEIADRVLERHCMALILTRVRLSLLR